MVLYTSRPRAWRNRLAVQLLLALSLVGCGTTQLGPRPPTARSSRAANVDELVAEARAEFGARLRALPTVPPHAQLQASLEASVGDAKSDPAVLSWYAQRGFRPALLPAGQWTHDTDVVVETLDRAHEHALRETYPHAAEFVDARTNLHRLHDGVAALASFEPTDGDWATVRQTLLDERFEASQDGALDTLNARLASADADNPMPRLGQRIRTLGYVSAQHAELVGRTEARLALALARYASEMRLRHADNTPELKPFVAYAKRSTRYRARVRAFLSDVVHNGADAAIAELSPKLAQYGMLLAARRRYVEIVRSGGWGEVTLTREKDLRPGRPHATVAQVKRRLSAEGYEVGPLNDLYDNAVRDAIALYCETHQLKVKRVIDRTLIKNLNLPAEDRLAKIDVTLHRMRTSLAGQFGTYILVNIPDFHAEVWRDGERAMRFGIVVGNNALQMDPVTNKPVIDEKTKDLLRPNRTPLQTAFMRYVIYNPYWNVPPRIRDEELEPKLVENPFWYEENGYEVMFPDRPDSSYVRQLPGPDNTLGRVKFIFPNPYDVYLHDTASKGLFRNPVRAYSHGCMRVSTPLEFAEHLLRVDGQWNASQVRGLLDNAPYKETTFVLHDPIPVHIVYFNTRVDDNGFVAFLSDIYRYDEAAVAKRVKALGKLASDPQPNGQSTAER